MTCILIVDDREENLLYLQTLLTGTDCTVESAHNGAEALAKARQSPPDLVVSDLLMPVMDGYTLLHHWKTDARLKAIPFVVYTATYTDADDERLALSLGADAFILKPMDPEALLARIREVQSKTEAGMPTLAKFPIEDEKELLKTYNETLIRKLEEKTLQLEESNRALREDIVEREKAELAQRQMAMTQMAILNALPAHIALVDAEGVIVSVNDAWRRFATANVLQGPEFCVGQNYLTVCEQATDDCSEEAQEAAAGIRRVLTGEEKEFSIEYPCHSPSTPRWFRLMVTPLREDERAGAVIMHVNITARKISENSVRESEQRLDFALTAADIGDWTLNMRTNATHRSLRHDQCFGYRGLLPEWSYDTFLAHIQPVDREHVDACFQRAMAGEGTYEDEFRVTWPDNSEHWLWTKGRFYLDEAGKPYRVAGIVADITERKQAEAALKASESRYHSLFENMLEGYAYCRAIFEEDQLRDFVYLEVNSAFETLTGLKNVVGNKVSDIIPGIRETNRELFEMYGRVALTGKPEKCEICIEPLDMWLSIAVYSSEREHFVAVFDNITARKQAEALLVQSRQRLALATESAQIGIWDWDVKANKIVWDTQMIALYGIREQDFTGAYDTWQRGLHPEDREQAEAGLSAALAGGQDFHPHFRILWPNGEVRHIEAHALVQRAPDGSALRMIGVNWDITERKQTEEALRRSEALFRTLINSSWDAFHLIGPNGQITYESPAVTRLLGYEPEEMIGHSAVEFVHPNDLEKIMVGGMALLDSPGAMRTVILRVRHKNGSWRWVESFEVNLVNHPDVGAVAVNYHDITERVQVESRLRHSEANLAASQRIAHLGSWELDLVNVRDLTQGALRWSDEVFRIWGYEPGSIEVSYENFLAAVHPDDRGLIEIAVSDALRESRPYDLTHRIFRPDGAERIVREMAEFQFEEVSGRPLRMIGTVLDITEQRRAEEELRASEAEFRTLAEAMPQIVWTTRADGANTYFNQQWMDYTGLTLEESLGSGWNKPFHPDDQQRAWDAWQHAIAAIGTYAIESRLRGADGVYRWYLVRGVPLQDAAGNILKWFGTCTDIHDLKLAEQEVSRTNREIQALNAELEMRVAKRTAELERANVALREEEAEQQQIMAALSLSEERFRLLVETVHDYAILMMDTTGHIMTWNAGAESMKGYRAEEIIGQHFSRFYTEEDQHAGTPEQELCTAETEGYVDDEGWRVRQDGSWFWATVVITALRDDSGQLRGFAKITRDITERKQIEAELQRSQEELQSFIDAMSTLAAKVSPDGKFLIFNKIALDASGLPYEEYQNTNFLEGPWWTFDSQVQARVGEKFREALTGTPINYDEHIFIFGQIRTISFSLTPLCDAEGKVEYLIAEGRDITVLKQTEVELQRAKHEADAANQAKSEFLSRMSHELRTPLNAILGFGQILEMDDMPPKRRENVQHILKGGRHLLDLINEVLDISRIEAGHLALSLEAVPVDSTVREVLGLVRPLTAVGNVQLINEIPAHSDWCMLADRQRLKQVLLNLASNAIKYNRGGGSVTIQGEEVSGDEVLEEAIPGQAGEQSRVLRLSIRDTGNGLSGDDMARLFVPFERLGAARTRIEGTGIGLSLSKRLVEAMGGQIGVSSTPGQGSTFWIELPLVPNPLQSAHEKPETLTLKTVNAPEGEPKTVLCIEDNLANVRLIEVLLEAQPNVRLLTAMQGSTGLDLAFQHSPDLILLDLHLPDINGDEVLRRLQAKAVTRSIPVVMISADATPGQIEKLLAAGAKTYLTKPLNVIELLGVLDESLKGKE